MPSHTLSYVLVAAAAFSFSAPAMLAADHAADGVKACAVIRDKDARLDCFDKLAAQAAPEAKSAPEAKVTQKVKTAPEAKPAAAAKPTPATSPTTAPQPPAAPVTPTAPIAQTKPEQFGSEQLPAPKTEKSAAGEVQAPKQIDKITATVSDYAFSLRKRFTVFLDNGQIWRQQKSDIGIAHFPHHGKITVTITRGVVGGYNLTINDSYKVYKVRRVK